MTPLAPALLCLALAGAPQRPILCAELQADGAEAPALEAELVRALRTRIARRELRVMACGAVKGRTASWRVRVQFSQRQVQVELEGRREWRQAELEAQELPKVVALAVADEVRPAVDALLRELGLSAEDEPLLPDEPETPPPPPPPPPVVPEDRPRSLGLGLSAGPVGGVADPHLTGAVSLAVTAAIARPLELEAWLGAQLMPVASTQGATGWGQSYELGADARWRAPWGGVGLGGRARLTVLRYRPAPTAALQTHTSWDAAVEGSAQYWPLRAGPVELGLTARLALFVAPRRFLVGDATLYRQSLAELFLGPAVRWVTR